jgi:hypothetical protein
MRSYCGMRTTFKMAGINVLRIHHYLFMTYVESNYQFQVEGKSLTARTCLHASKFPLSVRRQNLFSSVKVVYYKNNMAAAKTKQYPF